MSAERCGLKNKNGMRLVVENVFRAGERKLKKRPMIARNRNLLYWLKKYCKVYAYLCRVHNSHDALNRYYIFYSAKNDLLDRVLSRFVLQND